MALPLLLLILLLATPAITGFARRGDAATVVTVAVVTAAMTAGLAHA